jgi:tellurite resistance-related uncharacterized protein
MATTTIARFHQDGAGDWVAELACGHARHMRHRPPFETRPWVQSEAERSQRIGADIDCVLCDMPALPAGLRAYKRTATFTEDNVPAGLLRDHDTNPGVWALIVLESGTLEYTLEEPVRTFLLTPENPGVIPPVVRHRVKLLGPVRFYVEFLSAPPAG